MEFYWEGIRYILNVEYYNGKVETYTFYTEEDLAKGIERYSNQILSFYKVIGGTVL